MNIIVDSTFNPFSYKDLMLPIYDYKLAYEETEAAYSDLVTLTEAWKDIANREKSPEAYAMYKSYADLLNAIVDDFSQGMNSRNRRQLLGMKRRYASEITPIARASEAMQAANALRDQAGPDAIFEVGRYDSIDSFLHGKTANNRYESRKDIAARTAALSLAVALSILEDPIIKQSMSPLFLEVILKRGLGSLDELQAAIAGNPAAANRFALIRNLMIDQVGGLDRFDAQGRAAIEGAINEGLYAGLNNYLTSLQQNGEYMTKAQRVSAAQSAAELAFRKQQAVAFAPRAITDANGKPTGKYYDPKINMIVDDKGNIVGDPTKVGTRADSGKGKGTPTSLSEMNTTERKALLSTVSRPLYFNAGGGTGNSGHRDTAYYSWQGGSTEGYEHNFSLLTGKGKTRALNYIGLLIGISNFADSYNKMSAGQKQVVDSVLEQNVKVWRDQDWLSDNHFAVYLRGADYLNPGTPGNEAELAASYQAIQRLAGTASFTNVKPK